MNLRSLLCNECSLYMQMFAPRSKALLSVLLSALRLHKGLAACQASILNLLARTCLLPELAQQVKKYSNAQGLCFCYLSALLMHTPSLPDCTQPNPR